MKLSISLRGLLIFALAWLALPAVALADDCSSWSLGELPSCALLGTLLPPLLAACALLAAANWLRSQTPSQGANGAKDTTPQFPRQFNTWREFNEWAEETDYDGPPPPYLAPGGVPPVNLPPTPPGS